jgi:AraC-like DNA-binding protein
MTDRMKDAVAAAAEAAMRELAELDERDDTSAPVRARRQAAEPSQVYSIRVPVDRIVQLRRLADQRGMAPTVLMRQFVLERLDQETAAAVTEMPARDVNELRLGPSRSTELADVLPLREAR